MVVLIAIETRTADWHRLLAVVADLEGTEVVLVHVAVMIRIRERQRAAGNASQDVLLPWNLPLAAAQASGVVSLQVPSDAQQAPSLTTKTPSNRTGVSANVFRQHQLGLLPLTSPLAVRSVSPRVV